jgi:hypothetical protein
MALPPYTADALSNVVLLPLAETLCRGREVRLTLTEPRRPTLADGQWQKSGIRETRNLSG